MQYNGLLTARGMSMRAVLLLVEDMWVSFDTVLDTELKASVHATNKPKETVSHIQTVDWLEINT